MPDPRQTSPNTGQRRLEVIAHRIPINQTHICPICAERLATKQVLDGHIQIHYDHQTGRLKSNEEDFYAGLWQYVNEEVDWKVISDANSLQSAGMGGQNIRANAASLRTSQLNHAGDLTEATADIECWLDALPDEFQQTTTGVQFNSQPQPEAPRTGTPAVTDSYKKSSSVLSENKHTP